MNTNVQPSKELPFEIEIIDQSPSNVKGYYARSTACIRIENCPTQNTQTQQQSDNTKRNLSDIAKYLIEAKNPQVIIFVHGYANKKSDMEERSKKIYEYACKHSDIKDTDTVFIGYRWPAENPIKDDPQGNDQKATLLGDKFRYALQALPTLLLVLLIGNLNVILSGIFFSFVTSIWQFDASNLILKILLIVLPSGIISLFLRELGKARKILPDLPSFTLLIIFPSALVLAAILLLPNYWSLIALLVISALLLGIVTTLVILRLSAYTSDRFRAANYGVLDLMEFIRQIDDMYVGNQAKQQDNLESPTAETISKELPDHKLVKLTFIGHSLGCEVITQTIRILSDVFSSGATGDNPDPQIGHIFSLERLVLVAPDIPLQSILPGRANFLRSSLKRCQEAYVFSNEGDLALRLASTAANYFSFPSITRFRGYKLGNITVKHFQDENDTAQRKLNCQDYGIVNWDLNQNRVYPPHNYLEIRSSNLEHKKLAEFDELKNESQELICDRFSYFDCTDYKDDKNSSQGLLSQARGKAALNFWDYVVLAWRSFGGGEQIEVHGGYFNGEFSQDLIYRLAFLGFKDFIKQKDVFAQKCKDKHLQVLISPSLVEFLK